MRVALGLFAAVWASAAVVAAGGQQHVFGAVGDHHQQQHPGVNEVLVSWETQPGRLYESSRLIKVSESVRPRWLDIGSILALRRAGVRFMDITDAQELHAGGPTLAPSYASHLPQRLGQKENTKGAVAKLTEDLYGKVLEPFTAFHNRYYDSENGRRSSEWLQKQVEELVAGHNITVAAFKHRFAQPSVVARIEGASDETVVISAHQDSVNMWLPWFGRASGADDDGSGTVTILEALRAILEQGFKPQRTVEFHWYAGEEGGLLGSQDVAQAYKRESRKVVANMHFDMTGFWRREDKEVIGLVADHTDPELRALVTRLAAEYTRLQTREFECGYACSDHASWNTAGYRSAMAFESDKLDANTNIHSPADTVATLDFAHMLEFSKLAVAFAYEVGYADEA